MALRPVTVRNIAENAPPLPRRRPRPAPPHRVQLRNPDTTGGTLHTFPRICAGLDSNTGRCARAMAYYAKSGEPPGQWVGRAAKRLDLRCGDYV
jgi:hypothetical protein